MIRRVFHDRVHCINVPFENASNLFYFIRDICLKLKSSLAINETIWFLVCNVFNLSLMLMIPVKVCTFA